MEIEVYRGVPFIRLSDVAGVPYAIYGKAERGVGLCRYEFARFVFASKPYDINHQFEAGERELAEDELLSLAWDEARKGIVALEAKEGIPAIAVLRMGFEGDELPKIQEERNFWDDTMKLYCSIRFTVVPKSNEYLKAAAAQPEHGSGKE